VTAEELNDMRKVRYEQQRAEYQALQEARDIQEFERLKLKFVA
jgi:hypothetical protein